MATTKKAKVSDESGVEHDTEIFDALEQVQQKLDQVCLWGKPERVSGVTKSSSSLLCFMLKI